MKQLFYFFTLLFLALPATAQQEAYRVPTASQVLVKDVPWNSARSIGDAFSQIFKRCDAAKKTDNFSCPNTRKPGKTIKGGCASDPNLNHVLFRFPDNTIFFDAKMSVDADGSDYAKKRDGDGVNQSETSLKIGGKSLDAAKIPFIVVPQNEATATSFKTETGIGLGDIAVVIYKDKIVYAIVADEGPSCRLGEGSMNLHEKLGHHICRNAACSEIRDVSIEKDVLYFVFPNSDIRKTIGLTLANLNQKIEIEGKRLFDKLLRPSH
jgi:hypothetical protein